MSDEEPKRYYPTPGTDGYYTFERDEDGWRWYWQEAGQIDAPRPAFGSRAEALREAADDWEENGSGVSRFAGMLRGLAKKEEAK